jgi:hypothetical protein
MKYIKSLFEFFELLGVARAAASLTREGYHEEARSLLQQFQDRA